MIGECWLNVPALRKDVHILCEKMEGGYIHIKSNDYKGFSLVLEPSQIPSAHTFIIDALSCYVPVYDKARSQAVSGS